MKKYLYGASIFGIQRFIFQTSKLKAITGASEIVKNVCESVFTDEFLCGGQPVVNAAGNIKCIYERERECRAAVLRFPKRVMEAAPGITIHQAVVVYDDGKDDFGLVCEELEKRLRAQRNRPFKKLDTGLIATERSRATGLPAIAVDGIGHDADFMDEGTLSKRRALGKNHEKELKLCHDLFGKPVKVQDMGLDMKDLTGRNDWIAVIHVDGNGLGEVVAAIGNDRKRLSDFSKHLDHATRQAARTACQPFVVEKHNRTVYPIRPVLLGGDDLTVICRADVALAFVRHYLEAFEKESLRQTGHALTACAGIAFIKSSYPFHYGYRLAETLCGKAKEDAKSDVVRQTNDGKAPSCLMFHKVQSSFVENFSEIRRKELTPKATGCTYMYGPYYLASHVGRPTIDHLIDTVGELSDECNNEVKTAVREWLTLMAKDKHQAEQKRKRVQTLLKDKKKTLYEYATAIEERNDGIRHIPAYDLLALYAVANQTTN